MRGRTVWARPLLLALLGSVPAGSSVFGGGHLNQISTVFSVPIPGCPICATVNSLTGNCSCPVGRCATVARVTSLPAVSPYTPTQAALLALGSELVQPIAAISDCAGLDANGL